MIIEREAGVPGDLPQVPVGIPEVTRIPAPEDLMSGPHNLSSTGHGLSKHGVHIPFGAGIIGNYEAAKSASFRRNVRVFRKLGPREKRQGNTPALEEGHALDMLNGSAPPKPFEKCDALFQVAHSKCDECDPLFHGVGISYETSDITHPARRRLYSGTYARNGDAALYSGTYARNGDAARERTG